MAQGARGALMSSAARGSGGRFAVGNPSLLLPRPNPAQTAPPRRTGAPSSANSGGTWARGNSGGGKRLCV